MFGVIINDCGIVIIINNTLVKFRFFNFRKMNIAVRMCLFECENRNIEIEVSDNGQSNDFNSSSAAES